MKRTAVKRRTTRPLRLEWVEAGSLNDHPYNWRRHPSGQMTALKAVLDDVGWAGALLFNETTGRLIDGHARKNAVGPRAVVPVLVGRWTIEQEQRILATLDPLSAMAVADGDALESLLADVDLDGKGMEDLAAFLDRLAEQDGNAVAPATPAGPPAAERKRAPRVTRFVCGAFTFEVERQAYDAWLSGIEAKTGRDADQVIKELRRRLKI